MEEQKDRDGDGQTGGGTDEGLVDPVGQLGSLGRPTRIGGFLESVDHAVDRSQETEQGTDPGDHGERTNAALDLFGLTTGGVLHGLANRLVPLLAPLNAGLENMRGRVRVCVANLLRSLTRRIGIPGFPEVIQKGPRKDALATQGYEALKTEGEGKHGGDAQGNHHGAALLDQAPHAVIVLRGNAALSRQGDRGECEQATGGQD